MTAARWIRRCGSAACSAIKPASKAVSSTLALAGVIP